MDSATLEAPRVLIADDQPHIQTALRLLLRNEGFSTEVASSPDNVMQALGEEQFDLLLMDLNYARDTTSGHEGLDLLARVQALDASLPVVAMTGWATLDLAVTAMRGGVSDFVQKPWENARLVDTIRREIARGRERRFHSRQQSRDLEDARHIQQGLLPSDLPQIDGWTIASNWTPASGVGGDYFDVIRFSPTRVGIAIGDVMGKGLPAALLMSNLQAVVRAIASEHAAPADVCAKVNRVMCGKMDGGRFITFFYCVLDAANRMLTWSNAGHNPGLVVHADGTSSVLADGGMVAGVFADSIYQQRSMRLETGDRLVLYTDGITEATSAADEEFGEERLAACVATHPALEAAPLRDVMLDAVTRFCAGHFHDDATLIVSCENMCRPEDTPKV